MTALSAARRRQRRMGAGRNASAVVRRAGVAPASKSARGGVFAAHALLLGLLSSFSPPVAAEVPARVVTLAPSLTEIVFALGAGARLVGVTSYCDYPDAAKAIDRVGSFLQPNIEVILSKRPDLVFAVPSPENRKAVESLRGFGVRVRVVRPGRLESIEAAIDTIAKDLGLEDVGARLVADIQRDVAAVRGRVAGLPRRRVLMVVGRRPLIAVGGGTYQSELIEMAGGVNVVGDSSEAWPHLSLERVLVLAPEVIVDSGMGSEDRFGERSAFWGAFPSIPAVRDDRVVGSGRYELLRAGPRVAETLGAMARFIHPEAFGATSDDRVPPAEPMAEPPREASD